MELGRSIIKCKIRVVEWKIMGLQREGRLAQKARFELKSRAVFLYFFGHQNLLFSESMSSRRGGEFIWPARRLIS